MPATTPPNDPEVTALLSVEELTSRHVGYSRAPQGSPSE